MHSSPLQLACCLCCISCVSFLQDVNSAIAQYYDVPTLSLRTASYRLAMHNHDPKFSFARIMHPDQRHPQDLGHMMIAELVIWLLQQTAIDLIERPYNQQDVEVTAEPLPAPMYQGKEQASQGGRNKGGPVAGSVTAHLCSVPSLQMRP